VLTHRPDLGTLVGEAQALRSRPSRVLPLLATHLSFPEIGALLFLSPNTVKSQAISLYRKLGVATRSQAVARSRELELLEG
jgi:LuxR family transcriptional regulator, maltose regulon positive regulatory protein